MSKTKTITVDDILNAYKTTGLKPRKYNIETIGGRCCAIGAICERDGIANDEQLRIDHADEHYNSNLVHGIKNGFDADLGSPPYCTGGTYAEGFSIGQAAKRQLIDQF